jgi:hypothetical protein
LFNQLIQIPSVTWFAQLADLPLEEIGITAKSAQSAKCSNLGQGKTELLKHSML